MHDLEAWADSVSSNLSDWVEDYYLLLDPLRLHPIQTALGSDRGACHSETHRNEIINLGKGKKEAEEEGQTRKLADKRNI